MATNADRIAYVPPEGWNGDVQAMFDMAVPPGVPVKASDFNCLRMFANNPRISEAWLRFSGTMMQGIALPARLREIATLRMMWRRQTEYEWVHHMLSGQRAGLTVDHVRAVQEGADAPIWEATEAWVIHAADDFCDRHEIADATWDGLAAHLDKAQILELFFVLGSYATIGWIFNSAKVEVEPVYREMAAAQGFPMMEG